MSIWAIIPVKPEGEGKARLAAALAAPARTALVEAMIAHVVRVVAAAPHVARICLVGPARPGFPAGIERLDDPGLGLNAAASAGLAHAQGNGASRVLVIHADLPQLSMRDVELLAVAPDGTLALAPDRHDAGTNALSLPLPEAEGFAFGFGADSFARHREEAARLGLGLEIVRSPGLQRDVDVAEDLPDAAALASG